MRASRLVPLLAVPAFIGAVILGSGAAAQSPAPRTITFTEREAGSTFTHIHNTKATSPQSNWD